MRITTQVFDCVNGRPAAEVTVQVERASGNGWRTTGQSLTDLAGYCVLSADPHTDPSRRLRVITDRYFVGLGHLPWCREVVVGLPRLDVSVLEVRVAASPFSYSVTVGRLGLQKSPEPASSSAGRSAV